MKLIERFNKKNENHINFQKLHHLKLHQTPKRRQKLDNNHTSKSTY